MRKTSIFGGLFSAIIILIFTIFNQNTFAEITGRIIQLSDGEYIRNEMLSGEVLYIHGYGFGSSSGRVRFQYEAGNIGKGYIEATAQHWGNSKIRIVVPTTNYDVNAVAVYIGDALVARATFRVYGRITNDPYSSYQKYLETTNLKKIWDTGFNAIEPKEDIIVAIIDDGIYQNHEDLNGVLWRNSDEVIGNNIDDDKNGYVDDVFGYNFVHNNNEMTALGSHGTAVAGVIAAIKDNEIGVSGITSHAILMPIIACNSDGCSDEAILSSIYYAVNNGARVINLSLSSRRTSGYNENFDAAIKYAYENNVAIIASAGNGDVNGGVGFNLNDIPQSPVCNDVNQNMVLGVGSSTIDGQYRTSWSNYGSCVDVYAQGEKIGSTKTPESETDSLYEISFAGTSFSAPIVTGIATEIISAYPKISNSALYGYILSTPNNAFIDVNSIYWRLRKFYNPKNEFILNETVQSNQVNSNFDNIFIQDAEQSQFKDAIIALKNLEVISGYEDGTFKPVDPINRAEFMKIVVGAAGIEPTGKNCFSDVGEEWFASYVCAGMANGIVGGYPDGSFKPEQQINVAEALKITLKAFGIETREANSGEAWYAPFTEYARNNGYYLNTFNNDSKQLTREDMAELVYRMISSE